MERRKKLLPGSNWAFMTAYRKGLDRHSISVDSSSFFAVDVDLQLLSTFTTLPSSVNRLLPAAGAGLCYR